MNNEVAYARSTTVGVIDLSKILAEVPQAKAMKEKIDFQFLPRLEEINSLQRLIKLHVGKLKSHHPQLKDQARRNLLAQVTKEWNKLFKLQEEFDKDKMAMQKSLQDTLIKEIEMVVNTIAKEKKIDLVFLVEDNILYRADKLDLTAEVMETLTKTN